MGSYNPLEPHSNFGFMEKRSWQRFRLRQRQRYGYRGKSAPASPGCSPSFSAARSSGADRAPPCGVPRLDAHGGGDVPFFRRGALSCPQVDGHICRDRQAVVGVVVPEIPLRRSVPGVDCAVDQVGRVTREERVIHYPVGRPGKLVSPGMEAQNGHRRPIRVDQKNATRTQWPRSYRWGPFSLAGPRDIGENLLRRRT